MTRNTANQIDSSKASQQRSLLSWLQLFGLLAFGLLAAPFFCGKVYTADDLGEFHLPIRDFYSRQLAAGQAFDWHPGLYGGFYLTGEGQLGAYHPWHWLLYRTLPVGAAFDVELLSSYLLMVAGMFWLLRRRLRDSAAALFGGLLFALSGFSLLHFVHPNAIAVVAHIPWLLWAIDVACGPATRIQRTFALMAISLFTGSQLLLGYPQYVWFSLVAQIGYAAWRLPHTRAPWQAALYLAGAQFCGLLIGCAQLMPTIDALQNSTRQGVDPTFTEWGSLHPLNLVQWFAPYLFRSRVVGQNTHELGLYDGVVPIVLCIWLFAQRAHWGRLRPLIWTSLILATVGMLLAFGEFTPFYKLQSWLPLVGHFRFPCRAIVLVHLAMACGAAAALALLLRRPATSESSQRTPGVLWLLVGCSTLLAAIGPIVWQPYTAGPLLVWVGPLLMCAAVALLTFAERGSRAAVLSLVLLAIIDQCAYGLSYSFYDRFADLNQFVAASPHSPANNVQRVAADLTQPGERTLRIGNRLLLAGARRVDGYAGLEPAKQLDYRNADVLRAAGVGLVRRSPTTETIPGLRRVSHDWLAVPNPLPRARLTLDTTCTTPNQTAAAASASKATTAIAEFPVDSSCRVVRDEPGDIALAVSTPVEQLLVLTESFHSGWQAAINGRSVPVVRVDGDFLGVVVEPGESSVQFEFRPRSLRTGIILSGCGVGFMLCLCWARLRSAR